VRDAGFAKVISVQVGQPKTVGNDGSSDPMDQVWTTGFFKEPTSRLLWLSKTNLDGDGQADLENHGGPEKAVNVYPIEHYSYWADALSLDLPRGSFGENFTIEGILESNACIGDIFEIGESLVQVSQPRQPCWKLARGSKIWLFAFKKQVERDGTSESSEKATCKPAAACFWLNALSQGGPWQPPIQ
jgi:MOSC domain-containing protein YiiM